MSQFKKAERKQVPLKLAITGPSGSGKTRAALTIAQSIAMEEKSRIAVLDTENGSAALYTDLFDFDVIEIDPPYTTDKYISGINNAIAEGYKVVILDSITHAWAGEGGLLQQKEILDKRGGNQYTNWASITKKQEEFMARVLHSDIHLIATMRSKTEYILVEENGKSKPKKAGMAPVQRDGVEYEFTIVFDLAMNHTAEVSKDRTGLFDSKIFMITAETGKELMTWLKSGKPVEIPKGIFSQAEQAIKSVINEKALCGIEKMLTLRSWTPDEEKLLAIRIEKKRRALAAKIIE